MNIIVGATGQVGSNLLKELKNKGSALRAVVRNPGKLQEKGLDTRVADLLDATQLANAFEGGTAAFVITPENPASTDIIAEAREIAENYKTAIRQAGIRKVVALSCVGAHVDGDTGNILMSRILEQTLDGLDIEKIFIRPSYYFSNWLAFLEPVRQFGVLPTFFPADLKFDMHSPLDLAKFAAEVMTGAPAKQKTVYELAGPRKYSSLDVAGAFSKLLGKAVTTQSIPPEKWEETLLSAGFTENTAANLAKMTQAVVDRIAAPEKPGETVRLRTTLEEYLNRHPSVG